MLNEDYRDMLQILLGNRVRFLVVGAYALGAHGYPRATGDFDLWVDTSADNSRRIYTSLAEFGAPLSDISETTFTEEGIIFQIGIAQVFLPVECLGNIHPKPLKNRIQRLIMQRLRIGHHPIKIKDHCFQHNNRFNLSFLL